jgi:hypothetical protein
MKKMSKTALAVALTAAMGFGSTNVMALVLNPFTVDEGSVPGAISNVITNAGGFSGAYTEVVTFDGAGNFSTSIKWTAGSIYDTSNNVLGSQLNAITSNGYGMYGLFVASGTYVTVAGVTTFTFNPGGNLGIFIDAGQNTTFATTPANGATSWVAGGTTSDDYQIASGAAVGGTGSLNPFLSTCESAVNPGGVGNFCGSFGVNTSFDLTNPNGPLYFTAPSPFYNLSFNSGQLKAFEVAGTQTISGSLDVNFARVPEPATLALMGLGLLGMGATTRRRKSA